MEEIISQRQEEIWSNCLQKQKRQRILTIAAAMAVNILLCLFWVKETGLFFPWINIAVDAAAFGLVYTRYMIAERTLSIKIRLAKRLIKQKQESCYGRVVCVAEKSMTVRGIPCTVLRLETQEGMREILAVERPSNMEPGDGVHVLTANNYLLAWEQKERKDDPTEQILAEEDDNPAGRKAAGENIRKAHLQRTWWVYLLVCMAFAAFWLTLSEIWDRPSGQETLHVVAVTDVLKKDDLSQALEKLFQDSFRRIVVEKCSPSDPMLAQRLAIAAADGKDLVVLPGHLLVEDIGDTYFMSLERETAEQYFSGREQYAEQGKVYGIKIQNGIFFPDDGTDGGFYLFFTGASENLSVLTGNGEGNNAALEVAMWLTGGME